LLKNQAKTIIRSLNYKQLLYTDFLILIVWLYRCQFIFLKI